MDDQNLTPQLRFFVAGRAKVSNTWVILQYSKIDKGWASAVVYGKAPELFNVYVSNETRDQLAEWFGCDLSSRPFVTENFDHAVNHIARKSDQCLRL